MRFILADFLHDAQEIDAGEEIPPRELGNGFRWQLGGGVAQLVDGGDGAFCCVLAFLKGKGRELVFDFGDGEGKFAAHFYWGWDSFVFTPFFGFKDERGFSTITVAESEETMVGEYESRNFGRGKYLMSSRSVLLSTNLSIS
jgi:hypothetical protein